MKIIIETTICDNSEYENIAKIEQVFTFHKGDGETSCSHPCCEHPHNNHGSPDRAKMKGVCERAFLAASERLRKNFTTNINRHKRWRLREPMMHSKKWPEFKSFQHSNSSDPLERWFKASKRFDACFSGRRNALTQARKSMRR